MSRRSPILDELIELLAVRPVPAADVHRLLNCSRSAASSAIQRGTDLGYLERSDRCAARGTGRGHPTWLLRLC